MNNNLLSISNLINIFKNNEVNDDLLKISSSHDAFLVYQDDLSPIKYTSKLNLGIKVLLERLDKELTSHNYTTELIYLDGNIFGIQCKDSFKISVKAGGQLTFTTSSVLDIKEMYAELDFFHSIISPILEEYNISLLRVGYHPTADAIHSNKMPSDFYTLMRRNLEEHDPKALYSLYGTADISMDIKYKNEEDMIKKFRIASFLQPYISIFFASSAYFEGRETKILSNRMRVKQDMKHIHSGLASFCFDEDFSYQKYLDYVLKKPMFAILINDKYEDVANQTMESFWYGTLEHDRLEVSQRATLDDFQRHLKTIKPAISLTENGLKLRLSDSNNRSMVIALSALIKGLLFDNENMEKLYNMIASIPKENMIESYEKSHTCTLKSTIHNITVIEQIQQLTQLAEEGLFRLKDKYNLNEDETRFLNPISKIITSKKTFADEIIEVSKTDILEVFKYVNGR